MVAEVRKSKRVITFVLLRNAVAALSERNGSSAESIFNYLVWERQVNSEARKQAVLVIKKAVKAGILVKKSGGGFVVPKNQSNSNPVRESETHEVSRTEERAMNELSKKATRVFRGEKKKRKRRKSKARRWSKARKSSKKVQTFPTSPARTPAQSRKTDVNHKPKSANNGKPVQKIWAVPQRKCTVGVRYKC